jgi:two-component system response regulator FixJ
VWLPAPGEAVRLIWINAPAAWIALINHRSRDAAPNEGPSMTNTRRSQIAVVDDDHAVRESLRFLLEVAGKTVVAFASATDFLTSECRQIACLILDHHMPGMTGLDLVEQLRAGGSAIPVMLITGSKSHAMLARAAALGVGKVLEKPVDEVELLDFVDEALASSRAR